MNLPRAISETAYGYRVRIYRANLTYRAYIAFAGDKPAALQKAVALRDRCEAALVRSNTGHRGISEQTKWFHGRPYPCFEVTHGKGPRRQFRRFTFQTLSQRDIALQQALSIRARMESAHV